MADDQNWTPVKEDSASAWTPVQDSSSASAWTPVQAAPSIAATPGSELSAYKPSLLQRAGDYISSAFRHAREGQTPSGAPLPEAQLAGHVADIAAPRPQEGTPVLRQPTTGESVAAAGEVAKDVTGARGYSQMGRAAKRYAGTFDTKNYPTEEAASRARTQSGTELIGGAMEAATPLFVTGAAAAPAKVALGIGAGMAAGAAGGKIAEKIGATPETQELVKAVSFFVPSVLGAVAGVRTGATGNLSRGAAGVRAFGGRFGAAVGATPEEFSAGVKFGGQEVPGAPGVRVGGTQFKVAVPRTQHPAPAPEIASATSSLAKAGQASQAASRVSKGLSPVPPPPPAPPTPAKQFGNHLTPDHIRGISQAIASLPEAQRGAAMTEAHDNLTKWLVENGRVTIVGKLYVAKSPEQASDLAQKIINDGIDAHDRTAHTEPTQPQAATGAPATQRLIRRTRSTGTRNVPQSTVEQSSLQGSTNISAPPAMGKGMTTDSPAVAKVAQEAVTAPGQEPLVMVKKESPETAKSLAEPAKPPTEAGIAKIGTEDKASGRDVVQPTNSEMNNSRLAAEAAPELTTRLSNLAAGVEGAKFDRLRPQKNLERINEKIEDGKPPATVPDYLAAQVSADSPQAKADSLAKIQQEFKVLSVEDHFDNGDPKLADYASTKIQVQLSNGLSAEVQIVPRELQEITDQSHHFYTEGRKAEQAGNTAERDKNFAEASKMNRAAVAAFKERNGIGAAPIYEQEYVGPADIDRIESIKDNASLPSDVRSDAKAVYEAVIDSGMPIDDAMRVNGTDALAKALGGRFNKTINAAAPTVVQPEGWTPVENAKTVRLYRGEIKPGHGRDVPEWIKQSDKFKETLGASGRWFTSDLKEAQEYAKEAGEHGHIRTIEVSAADAEKYKAGNNPEANKYVHRTKREGPNDEYFLPRDVADKAVAHIDAKVIIESAGGKYSGKMEGTDFYDFMDPVTGSNMMIRESEITPEAVKAKMEAKRAEFAAAGGLTKEQKLANAKAAIERMKATKKQDTKLRKPLSDKEMAEYFKPGNVVPSWGGASDKVIAFHPGVEGAPYPRNNWSVEVVAVNQDGSPIDGEFPRIHHTSPDTKDVVAFRKAQIAKKDIPRQADTSPIRKAPAATLYRDARGNFQAHAVVQNHGMGNGWFLASASDAPKLRWPEGTSLQQIKSDIEQQGFSWKEVKISPRESRLVLTHIETENAERMDSKPFRDAEEKGHDIFVRFGDIPKSGKSFNHATGKWEDGVSVFRARRLNGYTVIKTSGDTEIRSLFNTSSRPLYLVTGKEVGQGGDGEPVLSDAKAIKLDDDIAFNKDTSLTPTQSPSAPIKAEYTPNSSSDHPIVELSRTAQLALNRHMSASGPWNGAVLEQSNAMRTSLLAKADADRWEQYNPEVASDMRSLADTLDKAIADANGGPIVMLRDDLGAQRGQVLREELFHAAQVKAGSGVMSDHVQGWEELTQHPAFDKAAEGLRGQGYAKTPDFMMVTEIAAKIASGQGDVMQRITPQEAGDFIVEYFDRVAKTHGVDALDTFDDPRILDSAVMDNFDAIKNFIASRREHEASTQAQPTAAGQTEGRNSGTGGPVRQDSTGPPQTSDRGLPRQAPAKGDTVTLKSGETGTVKFVHPEMRIARVQVAGKTRTIRLSDMKDMTNQAGFANMDIPFAMADAGKAVEKAAGKAAGAVIDAIDRAAGPVKDLVKSTDWWKEHEQRTKNIKASKDLEKGLLDLDKTHEATTIEAQKLLEKAGKESTAATRLEVDRYIDSQLTRDQRPQLSQASREVLDNYVDPLRQANNAMFQELQGSGIPIEFDPAYLHRVVMEKPSPLESASEGKGGTAKGNVLSTKTPSTKSRVYYALEDRNGVRRVVSYKDGAVSSWRSNLPTPMGETDTFTPGQQFEDKNGKKWTVGNATKDEIEANTGIRYYRDPVAVTVVDHIQLARAVAAKNFLEDWKASNQFQEVAVRPDKGEMAPKGWKDVSGPVGKVLFGYHFEPRTAEVLQRLSDKMVPKEDPGVIMKTLGQVADAVQTSVLMNPLMHAMNMGDFAMVGRGAVENANPLAAPRAVASMAKAVNQVCTRGPDFVAALDNGANLLSHKQYIADLNERFVQIMTGEMERDKSLADKMRVFLGLQKGDNPIAAMRRHSHAVAFMSSDAFYMQSLYEKMAQGMTMKEAVTETNKVFPDYQIPTRVLDQKWIGDLMRMRGLSWFNGFHVGKAKAYANMAADAFKPGVDDATRGHALSQVAMLALALTVVYKTADEVLKRLSGEPNARNRRFGLTSLPFDVGEVAKGNKSPAQLAKSQFTPSALVSSAVDILENRDFAGNKIYNPYAGAATKAGQVAKYAATSTIGPLASYEQMERDTKPGAVKRASLKFGIGASFSATNSMESDAQRLMHRMIRDQLPSMTPEDRQEVQARQERQAAGAATMGEMRQKARKEQALKNFTEDARYHFPRLPYRDVKAIYEAATPEEQEAIRPFYRMRQIGTIKRNPVEARSEGVFEDLQK